jgi:hypothetical protein
MEILRQLGYYDFQGASYSLNIQDIREDYGGLELHERIHAALALWSILGLFCVMLRKSQVESADNSSLTMQILGELLDRTREVHEGTATYMEFRDLSTDLEHAHFFDTMVARGEIYLKGLSSARLIDQILSKERLIDFGERWEKLLRLCTLIDISRFALNVPIITLLRESKEDDPIKAVKAVLATHNPTERWTHVLTSLAYDAMFANEFISRATPMFQRWIQKSSGPSSVNGTYAGILHEDNVEAIISELFPEMRWDSPDKELYQFPGISFTPKPESLESYLVRSNSADLNFAPRLPIQLLPIGGFESLLETIKSCLPGGAYGCYIKIIVNVDQERSIALGTDMPTLKLAQGNSLVLYHPATFIYQLDKRRIWRYEPIVSGFILPTSEIDLLIGEIKSDDCVVVFDVDISQQASFQVPFLLRRPGLPIFVVPSPTGSFASFLTMCKALPYRNYPLEVFLLLNWAYFSGVHNESIYTTWIIPRLNIRDYAIVIFGTRQLHFAINEYLNSDEAESSGVRLATEIEKVTTNVRSALFPLNGTIEDPWSQVFDSPWTIDPENEHILHGPNNADIATAHIISFGI